MKISTILDLNLRMIKANNSCDHTQAMQVMEEIMSMPEKDIDKAFRKRYFFWNVFRGKDFYKMAAHYVCNTVQAGEVEKGIKVLTQVLLTAKSDDIRRAFVKAVTRNVPIVITGTVMYMSEGRLKYLLQDDQVGKLITDEITGPFVKQLIFAYKEADDLRDVMDSQLDF